MSLTIKDKQPVTGAFGWRLGDKLDPAKYAVDLDANGLYSLLLTGSDAPNIAPFSAVLICANKEAKIYSIYCSAHGLNDYLDQRHILVETLQRTYSSLSSFEDTYTFGDKERTVTLTCWEKQKGFTLEYRYEPLAKAIPAEQSPRRKQELQKTFNAL